ncbi:hypothetical protein B0H19DRAFT_1197196 [Mycena capillaripes]|nr:hypothetical protein B0H19DRAFT_1197196 [Mycena capillaripes]
MCTIESWCISFPATLLLEPLTLISSTGTACSTTEHSYIARPHLPNALPPRRGRHHSIISRLEGVRVQDLLGVDIKPKFGKCNSTAAYLRKEITSPSL